MILDPKTLERGDVVEFFGQITMTVAKVSSEHPGIVFWEEEDKGDYMDSWIWSEAEVINYGLPGYVGPFVRMEGTKKYSHWKDNGYSAKQLLNIADEINAKLGHLRKGSK
jgi:hypothetical protein